MNNNVHEFYKNYYIVNNISNIDFIDIYNIFEHFLVDSDHILVAIDNYIYPKLQPIYLKIFHLSVCKIQVCESNKVQLISSYYRLSQLEHNILNLSSFKCNTSLLFKKNNKLRVDLTYDLLDLKYDLFDLTCDLFDLTYDLFDLTYDLFDLTYDIFAYIHYKSNKLHLNCIRVIYLKSAIINVRHKDIFMRFCALHRCKNIEKSSNILVSCCCSFIVYDSSRSQIDTDIYLDSLSYQINNMNFKYQLYNCKYRNNIQIDINIHRFDNTIITGQGQQINSSNIAINKLSRNINNIYV